MKLTKKIYATSLAAFSFSFSPQKISTEQHLKSNRPGNKTALLVSQPITTTPTQNPSLPFLLSQESTSIEQPSNPSEVPVIKDTDDSQEGRDPTGKDNNVDFGLHLITPPKQNTRHNQNHSPEMFSSYEHATLSKGSKSDPIDVDVMGRTKSDRSRSGNRSSNGSSGSGNSYDRKTSSDRDKFRFPESTQRTRAASKMCRRERKFKIDPFHTFLIFDFSFYPIGALCESLNLYSYLLSTIIISAGGFF